MKKVWSVLLTLLLFTQAFTLIVSAANQTGENCTFFISVYDDINREYLLENTKLTSDENITVMQSLELLKRQKLITDYKELQNEVSQIVINGKSLQSTPPPDQFVFYVKINGNVVKEENFFTKIADGDIVEWIYSTSDKMITEAESDMSNPTTQNKLPASDWTQETQKIMQDGCDYLNFNKEHSSFYIVAMGCAGKTSDATVVNTLLSDIRQTTSYNSSTELAKTALSLTFAGYDATQLIDELSKYEDINKQGIFGSINALIAYDSKSYPVASDALNSRKALVDYIVSLQRDTGGFGITETSPDDLDTTAMAITALSPYATGVKEKAAIDNAVAFLQNKQTKTGGFAFRGQESSESLSQVIIALSSIGIQANDERFIKNGKTPVDNLLEYQNDDGGFSHIKGDASMTMSTEQAVIALASFKNGKSPYKTQGNTSADSSSNSKLSSAKDDVENNNLTIGVAVLTMLFAVLIVVYSIYKKRNSKY